MPFYAVARGHTPGIYGTWAECQTSISGYSGARYKKFSTESEAKEFVQENALNCPVTDRRQQGDEKEAAATATTTAATTGRKTKDRQNDEDTGGGGGRLSPTLLEMKHSMKRLQRDLSELRTRFDLYTAAKAQTDKRKRGSVSDEEEEKGESSAKKKPTPDSSKFKVDDNGFLVVYTDGACWMNGKQGAKAGMGVYFGPEHPLNVSEPIKGRATNNNAEIQAATCALELAHSAGFEKVAVHTDSKFMIDCASSWMKNWKKRGWVKADGEAVKNKEELIDLDKAMEGLAVKWVHVKGHSGDEGNEEADKLARQGAKRYTSEN